MDFFNNDTIGAGPELTDDLVAQAEAKLGLRLPSSYVALLRQQNGGIPVRRCFPMTCPTSWAPDHIEVSMLLGIGFEQGIDGDLGSAYLVHEWGYPDIGIVIFDTPSAGHDTIMLDYSECGPNGEPRVVYVDEDRSVLPVARDFASFVAALVDCFQLSASRSGA